MSLYTNVTLGLIHEVDQGKIAGFEISGGVEDVLAQGHIDILDNDGTIFSELVGIYVGAEVDIEIIAEAEWGKRSTYYFPTYYITRVEESAVRDPTKIAGVVTIHFAHEWRLYLDATNHAYAPTNNAELIKKILKDETRGVKFEIDDKNISKTDDAGKYARYKVGVTDYEFITQGILPYCSISQTPAHFFCTLDGRFKLKSFKQLYREQPKAIFGPTEDMMNDEQVKKIVETKSSSYGINSNSVYSIGGAAVKIFDESMISEVHPSFISENVNNGTSAAGEKILGIFLKKATGSSFGNVLPLSPSLVLNSKSTRVKIFQNRSLADALTLMFAGSAAVDNCFEFGVSTQFCGASIDVGDTVEVILPLIKYTEDGTKKKGSYSHWLSGKWLVSRISHAMNPESPQQLFSQTYLVRPTFVGNKKSTSLYDVESMYSVAG